MKISFFRLCQFLCLTLGLAGFQPAAVRAEGYCATSACRKPCGCNSARNGCNCEASQSPDAYTGEPTPEQLANQSFDLGEAGPAQAGDLLAITDPGYIDSAIIANRLRFRTDAAYGNPFPDRAEFFYAQCGCFPGGPGPGTATRLADRVNYQEVSGYLEQRVGSRFSGFVEMPFRMLDPDLLNPAALNGGATSIDNTAGLSDITAGFKYLLSQNDVRDITFQLRVYTPSGDADRGLGTGHFSLEPGVLSYRRWNDCLSTFGEFRIWVPLSDSTNNRQDFAGTVLRYGAGLSYLLAEPCVRGHRARLDGVAEMVGWSVLGGQKLDLNAGGGVSAAGDTIVNFKVGTRLTFDQQRSLAISYGTALTEQVWYQNIIRAEYQLRY